MARPNKRTPHISAELLKKVPALQEPGMLDTMEDLQAEWQRVHRAHFRRQLMAGEYNQLMYGLQSGATITRTRDELRDAREKLAQNDRIAEALEALPHRSASGHALDYDDGAVVVSQTENDNPLIVERSE